MRSKLVLLVSCLLLLSLAGLALAPRLAEAHALLVRSDPEAGAGLLQAPEQVTAWFSEPLEPGVSRLRVLDGTGAAIDAGKVQFDPGDPTKMSVGVPQIGPGFYLVTWETLSRVDGHFRFGSFEFTVLNADGSEPSGPRPQADFDVTGQPTGVGEGALTKIGGLIAAVTFVGGLAAVILIALPAASVLSEEHSRKLRAAARAFLLSIVVPATGVGALAGAGELWLQARQFGGLGELDRVLDTEWGERWILRHIFLGGVIAGTMLYEALRQRSRPASTMSLWTAFVAGLGYLLYTSLVSHANAVPQGSFWATASDFMHLATASTWIGGLVALATLLIWSRRALTDDQRPPLLATALQRFSGLAATSLVLLLATGVFNAFVQVDTWSSLIDTAYGRALLIKLVIVVPLLAVAGLNAFILRPRLVNQAAQDAGGVERLRRLLSRAVPLEAALGVAVLAVIGVLVQYTPARTETVAEAASAAAAGAAERDAYDYPLTTGDWAWVVAGVLVAAGVLTWIWAAHVWPERATLRRLSRVGAVGLSAGAVLIGVVNLATPGDGGTGFEAGVALRYQTTDGRLVLLEIDPFQVGNNRFRATAMTEQGEVVEAESVQLLFSRLESEDDALAVPMRPAGGDAYIAEYELAETGWWAIQAVLDGDASAVFYLRLDNPSRAPLEFAAPDYQSDSAAEHLFRETLERYESLSTLRWREELTSGLLDPTGIGAWVIANGEAEAPDKVHFRVLSPGASDYDLVRAGSQSCFRDKGQEWKCSESGGNESFDLDYFDPSTAFRFGRREEVDGETTQAVLFFNPGQGAWYTWWIGEETGQLRRQAMVAPGHFMLTQFFDHNQPVTIRLPDEAETSGG